MTIHGDVDRAEAPTCCQDSQALGAHPLMHAQVCAHRHAQVNTHTPNVWAHPHLSEQTEGKVCILHG